jgi:uroporphyrinogen decarboxylase
MNSYQRVMNAISFTQPDCLPLVFRCDRERSDIVGVGFSTPTGWAPVEASADEWGRVWANVIGTGIGQMTKHPLGNAPDLRDYRFPDPHAPGRFDGVRDIVRSYDSKYVTGNMGLSGFNLMMSLRGFENILMDIAMPSDFLTELMDKVWDYEAGIIDEYAKCGVHGIWLFDDWGTEDALFIRPSAWREFFKPRYREQFGMIHDLGMQVFFHSCGYVWDIIPDLIEAGVDVLNLEQPDIFAAGDMSGIDRMASCFGGKATFCTNPDGQRLLANGTPEEIEDEVKHIISAFSSFGGGLIPLADCGKDHHILPPDNIAAMEAAFIRYRGGTDV